MPVYKPQLDDIRFLLNEVLDAEGQTRDLPGYEEVDWETASGMIEMVGEYARDVLFPLNASADKEGCTYDPATKSVKTPEGFREAYETFRDMGLSGLTAPVEHGGLGMPEWLMTACNEMLCGANFSFAAVPGLTIGAGKVLAHYATDDLRKTYLEKMIAGQWGGTMCLTEPQCGTDLGLVKTRAVPQDDGSHAITGNKIFITNGEHDLTENNVHLVLARLPGAPEGIKGISLFLVPKFLPDEAGNPGERNAAFCTGIEEKMGIHGSATCSMAFEGAKGWLVGTPHKGMEAMFKMMNFARLKVGVQGLGHAELAYQNAADYAAQRVQGAAINDLFARKAQPQSVAIINHANIRRHLVDIKCQIDAYRALAYETAINLDIAKRHPEPHVRKSAEEYVSLLTPVVKACTTDFAMQAHMKVAMVFGGAWFINETGVNQYMRDTAIATIYEGTNDIQAMDFTFRKMLDPNDIRFRLGLFMAPLREEIDEAGKNPHLKEQADMLRNAWKSFTAVSQHIGRLAMLQQNPYEVQGGSKDFMDMFGRLALGRMWLKMMTAAHERLPLARRDGTAAFYTAKLKFGDHYMRTIMLPEMTMLEAKITDAGMGHLASIANDEFLPSALQIGTKSLPRESVKKARNGPA